MKCVNQAIALLVSSQDGLDLLKYNVPAAVISDIVPGRSYQCHCSWLWL